METPKKQKPAYNLAQNTLWMLGLAWKNVKSVIGYVIVVAVLAVVMNLLGLFVTPTLLAAIQNQLPMNRLISLIVIFALALMIVSALQNYVDQNILYGRLGVRLAIIDQIVKKHLTTSYPNLENQDFQKKNDKASMATGSNAAAAENIWTTMTTVLTNLLGFIVYLFLLSTLNPLIIGLVLITTIPGFFLNNHLYGWGYRHREEEAEHSHKMNYLTRTAAWDRSLAKDIRIFGMKAWIDEVYQASYRLYQDFLKRRERVYIWGDITLLVLTFLRNGLAYWFLIDQVLYHSMSVPNFLLIFTAVSGFATWVTGILTSLSTMHRQSLDISTIREVINFPEPFAFENGKALTPDLSQNYEITFKDVTFAYPGADQPVLEHINLTIHAGEKLAIVGLNGAGKTTLVKLACGFYDPTEGEILWNGQDIKQYNRRDLYKHISAVFQDFSVLAATVAENVAQTVGEIDRDKVKAALLEAGLWERIERLPKGLDTELTRNIYEDGTELSGGEMQRLMLARALYKNAPIIMLDEPTSALDPIAESEIYQEYNQLTAGRTSVFISHRLASTRFCDRILLIGQRKIMEEGTHDQLLEKNGEYARLFEIQSRYYKKGAIEGGQENG